MEKILKDVRENLTLVVAVAVTSVLGTILLRKLFSGNRRKFATGQGPTGRGKWTFNHCPTSPSSRCLWLMREMKVLEDFTIKEYDSPEESTMVTSEGEKMTNSAAICLCLAEMYGQCLPDSKHDANYFSWSVVGTATADRCVDLLYKQLYQVQEADTNTIKDNTIECLAWIESLEDLLKDDRKFICNRFTAADVIIGYDVFYASLIKGGTLLRDSPNVQAYLRRLKARPLWTECLGTARDWMTSSR